MKKSILVSSLLAASLLISLGCTKSQSHKDELNKTLAEINKKNEDSKLELEQTLANLTKLTTDGGQPGSITLNGEISKAADQSDARLSLSQSAGLTRTGSATTITQKDLLVVNSLSTEKLEELKASFKKSQENEKTFINLGCQLSEADTAGLTEVQHTIKAEDQVINLSATRIFMCGNVKYERLSYTISASEIMLKDLNIRYIKNVGSLRLAAATLVLAGQNRIETLGEDSTVVLLPGSSLDFTVTNEIFGDGQLALEAKGGNNIAEQQK